MESDIDGWMNDYFGTYVGANQWNSVPNMVLKKEDMK